MIYIKRIIIGLLSTVIILVASFIVLYSTTDVVNDYLSDYLNSVLYGKAEVSFKNLKGSLYNEAEFEDFEIVLKSGLRIRADYMRARFDLQAIIDGRYHLSYLYTDSLNIDFTDKSRKKSGLLTASESKYFDIYEELDNTEIVVNRIEVRKGRFRFSKTNEGVFDGINFDGHFIFTDEKIDVKVNNLKTTWALQDDLLLFKTHATGGRELIQFNQTEFRYNNSSLIGKILYKFNDVNDFNIFIDKSNIQSEDIQFISPQFTQDDYVNFNAQINGNHDGFNSVLNIDSAQYKNNEIQQTHIESYFQFDKSKLNVFKSNIELNGGTFQLNGSLFGDEGHKVHLKFQKLDLNQFGISIDQTNLNGKAYIEQTDIDFSGSSLAMNRVELNNSTVGTIEISKSVLKIDNDASGFYINEGSSISFDNDSEFNLEGQLQPDQNYMSIEISTDSAEISALMANFGIETLKGNVSSNTRVYGEISNPKAFVNVQADSLQLINEFMVYDANLNMILGSLASDLNGTGRLTSDSVRIAGNVFTEFDVFTNLNKDSIIIENVSILNDTNGLDLSGRIMFVDSISHYYIETFNVQYENYRLTNNEVIHFNSEDGGLFIDEFKLLLNDGGSVTVDGVYNINSFTNLNISLDDIEFRPFNQLFNYDHNINGNVRGDVHITDFENLTYDLNASIDRFIIYPKSDTTIFKKIQLDTVNFGDADLRYSYRNSIYNIERLQISDEFSDFNLSGEINTSYLFEDTIATSTSTDGLNLTSNFSNLDLNRFNVFIGYYKELEGLINGNLDVSGTIFHPRGKLSVKSDRLNINQLRYQGNLDASLDKDLISLENTVIKINETPIELSGTKKIDLDATNFGDLISRGDFDFNVKTYGDTITAISQIIPDIRAIFGEYESDLNIVGTLDSPTIKSGTLKFTDTQLILVKLANPILRINHTFTIEDGILKIDDFKGYSVVNTSRVLGLINSSQTGVLTSNGTIDLNNILHPIMDIDVQLDKFFANYHSMNAQVLLTSNNITVEGRDTLMLKGDIDLTQANILFDFGQMEKNFYESTQSISDRYTIMDFNITMRDNVRIYTAERNAIRSFDMYLKTPTGQPMNYFKGTEDKEKMRGQIEIESGTFTFFKPFEITNGVIDLGEQDNTIYPFNPKVEFQSQYESDEYLFEISLDDFLTNLSRVKVEVAFANSPNQKLPKDNVQIVNLLVFGVEDFSSINSDQTIKNILNIFASEQLDIIQEFNYVTQSDPNNPENSNTESAIKITTKQVQIYESWKVQAIFNSNNQNLFDLIETSVRVYDNLVIYLARDQSSDFTSTLADPKYNLRLQWYYEF